MAGRGHFKRIVARTAILLSAGVVSACTLPGPGDMQDGIFDPYEQANRARHEATKASDSGLLRPVAAGYVEVVPDVIQTNIVNFADTAKLPRTVLNQLLQGRPGDAMRNTLRFGINATLGIGGLADVASDLGLPRDESGFADTLYVWGAPEGAYLELPVLGPTTERHAVGDIVDVGLNPIYYASLPIIGAFFLARVGEELTERGRFGDTIDSVLYESADSYAQLRLIYLQNRRFELGDETVAGAAEDVDPLALDTEGF